MYNKEEAKSDFYPWGRPGKRLDEEKNSCVVPICYLQVDLNEGGGAPLKWPYRTSAHSDSRLTIADPSKT